MATGKNNQARLTSDEEALFIELFEHSPADAPFFFGQFLRAKGLISDEDIFNARQFQKTHNRRIGEVAVELGFISQSAVEKLLVMQEESGMQFGDLAIRTGYLSQAELDEVVEYIEMNYVFFGEALVRLEILEMHVMLDNLKIFKRMRTYRQGMDA